MIRRPPRSTQSRSSAASDVYKRQTQYVVKKGTSSVDGYEIGLSSAGKIFFRLNAVSSGDTYRINSTSTYPTNGSTWVHVVGVYDGTTMRLYVNCLLYTSDAADDL